MRFFYNILKEGSEYSCGFICMSGCLGGSFDSKAFWMAFFHGNLSYSWLLLFLHRFPEICYELATGSDWSPVRTNRTSLVISLLLLLAICADQSRMALPVPFRDWSHIIVWHYLIGYLPALYYSLISLIFPPFKKIFNIIINAAPMNWGGGLNPPLINVFVEVVSLVTPLTTSNSFFRSLMQCSHLDICLRLRTKGSVACGR